MKMSNYLFNLWYPLELGTFLISEDPPPHWALGIKEVALQEIFYKIKLYYLVFGMTYFGNHDP